MSRAQCDLYTLVSFSEAAANVMVELLGSYTEDNASQARMDAHRYDLLLSVLSFDRIWSFSDLYVRSALQVHRPCPERHKHLSVRPPPSLETSAFPGRRTHPRRKNMFLNEQTLNHFQKFSE